MTWTDAPLGLMPSHFRPLRVPAARVPPPAPKVAPKVAPEAAPAGPPWVEPSPAPDPSPVSAEPQVDRGARTPRGARWRICAEGLCRRRRRCLWRSEACLEASERARDPEAMASLLKALDARLGTGPQPEPSASVGAEEPKVAEKRRGRPGARRAVRAAQPSPSPARPSTPCARPLYGAPDPLGADMPTFHSDGIELAFRDEGEGDPILLIHGFASSLDVNWVGPGWFDALKHDGRRVIAIDNRGHGNSEKLYDPAFYGAELMAGDAFNLLDHLNIERADVMGYSMGARITTLMAVNRPERLRSAILGGMGEGLLRGAPNAQAIAEGLVAPSVDDVPNPMAKMFRKFAEATGADRKALSACMRMQRSLVDEKMLGSIRVPVLVAVGTQDEVSGDLDALVALIPGAEGLPIPRRDHNRAVGDKVYKEGVLSFLERRP